MTTPNNTGAVTALRPAFMAEVIDAAIQAMQANGLANRTERLQQVRDQLRASPPEDAPAVDGGDAVLRAANKLAAAAMTTGGVAGADPHLQAAIDVFIAARDAAMQSPTGEPT